MSILVNFEDYKVQLREINEYYEVTEALSASDGLMLAAGLTEYDGKSSIVEDPQYGIVKFRWKRWGINTLNFGLDTTIETKLCTKDDLNDVEGSNHKSLFYKLHERDEPILEAYGPKMKCFSDPEQLSIFGNFDNSQAQNLEIAFEMCNSETSPVTCKS